MTRINVATSTKLDEICDLLESQKEITYTYICNISNCEVTYEVNNTTSNQIDLLRYTKQLIQSLPFGKVIMTRVLYDGQLFDGGKIYQPDDYEYQVTHMHTYKRKEEIK